MSDGSRPNFGTDFGLDPDDRSHGAKRAEIRRLAALTLLDYEEQRAGAADRLGIVLGRLDKLVTLERREGNGTNGQGRPLDLPLPQPWDQPVDGMALCKQLRSFFDDYAVLPEHGAVALATWAIHTHCYPLWRYTPRLHLTAPTRRAGKTRTLNLLNLIVAKPLKTETITPAALFRTVEMAHPSLLLDECNALLEDNGELVSMLNAGYERGGTAVRTVGDDHQPRAFDVFCPVAMAGIGSLAGTLADRAITLAMQRALPSERRPKITTDTEASAAQLCQQIARWVADNHAGLRDATPDVRHLPDRIDDRWFPLFAVAEAVGAEWLNLVRDAAIGLTPAEDDSASLGEQLIRDLNAVWCEWVAANPDARDHEMASADLIERLLALPASRWVEMGRAAKPLTANRLARMLATFKVRPTFIGPEHERKRGYRLLDFEAVFAHILGKG